MMITDGLKLSSDKEIHSMEQLIKLEQGLIERSAANKAAAVAATQAEAEYDKAFEIIMENNAEFEKLFDKYKSTQELAKVAKGDYATAKTNAVKELAGLSDPEDIKSVDTFGYRVEKEAVYSRETFVHAAVKAKATFLLMPDEKSITSFVKNNAVKVNENWDLPLSILNWLGHDLDMRQVIKPTISDTKIAKKAAK